MMGSGDALTCRVRSCHRSVPMFVGRSPGCTTPPAGAGPNSCPPKTKARRPISHHLERERRATGRPLYNGLLSSGRHELSYPFVAQCVISAWCLYLPCLLPGRDRTRQFFSLSSDTRYSPRLGPTTQSMDQLKGDRESSYHVGWTARRRSP